MPVLTQPAAVGSAQAAPLAPAAPSYADYERPSVWRRHRPDQAAAKVEALVSNGMDEIEIPAFLRKQAD
jgi:cell division protein FtsZ